MLENEPFAKLPVPYIPLPKVNHYPPMFRLGFALPDPFAEFRRAALKNNLGDPEQLSTTQDFSWLRRLVMSHINERCGFPPEKGIGYRLVHSKETDLVIEIDTNYRTRIPEEKLDDALCVIREVLLLPGDAHPKWYLEPTITEKAPNKYCLPSESSVSTTMRRII